MTLLSLRCNARRYHGGKVNPQPIFCRTRDRRNTGARREKLLGQIEQELKVHTTIEEEIFYPAFQAAARKKEDQKMFYEAVHEHHVVDLVLAMARDGGNNEELKAKAKVLKETIEHHVEEEQDEMFPRARKVLKRDALRELGGG